MNVRTIRLLLWLKLTLSWRGYRSSKMKVLSAILFGVMLIPACMIAFGLHYVLSTAPAVTQMLIARDTLAVVFCFWLVSPLLGFQLNDSYDPTKLFCYPLSYWQIFAGSVIGGLLDPPVLLVLPSLVVLLIQFSNGPVSGVINLIAILQFMMLTIATAQAITIAMIGFLRSRRFRDITIVVLPLIGMVLYLGQQIFIRQFMRVSELMQMQRIYDAPVWHIANWLPPGFAAAAMAATVYGDWPRVLEYVAGLLLFTVLAIGAATQALKRLYFGDVASVVPQQAAAKPKAPSSATYAPRWLPDEVRVLASKDLAYFSRDPQYKAVLTQSMYTVVMLAVVFLLRNGGYYASGSGSYIMASSVLTVPPYVRLFGAAAVLIMATSTLIFNVFGADGAAVTVLFSFPTARRRILMAKNLAQTAMLSVIFVIGLTATAALTHAWSTLPMVFAAIVVALPILLACGNLVSIKLPHRMIVRGQRWQRGGVTADAAGGAGCALVFFHMLAVLTSWVVMSPAIAAVLIPLIFNAPAYWYLISLPLACVYSASLYIILLGVAETWLMAREPEIIAAVMPPD